MPANNPLVGEVWSLPSQSFSHSLVDDQAVIVDLRLSVVTLYARNGRRIVVPERSFLLTWNFVKVVQSPGFCTVAPCANPAHFTLGPNSVCWAHLANFPGQTVNDEVRFLGEPEPDIVPTYTNADLPSEAWWSKTGYRRASVVEVGPERVKFRLDGVPTVMLKEDFLDAFQRTAPEPPCAVGEEWVDYQGIVVQVVLVETQAAKVVDSNGRMYLLPFEKFGRWKKISRMTVFDRLNKDDEGV